ncbi:MULTISPECIES: hypothetical protein [Micromonospora]|uniref:hypothetical protein n=1 Tax=Micromonospora TaxID=1873 RepID=UPI000F86670B|nr:hypothetical protein [Verrucosispora sp. FIM060022]RUL93436.1 hypothetical protein EG812_06855 [Verrucosispora sp. FIM060022]
MRNRTLATVCTALALVPLCLSGCAPAAPAPPAATVTSLPPDPRAVLVAAAELTRQTTSTMTMGRTSLSLLFTATAAVDPAAGDFAVTAEVTADGKVTRWAMTAVNDSAFLRFDDLWDGRWLRMPSADVLTTIGLDIMPNGDPGEIGKLVGQIVEVRREAPGHFSGTLDLTHTSSVALTELPESTAETLRSLPFKAQIDAEGRLTELTLRLSDVDMSLGAVTVAFGDFGATPDITPPAAAEVMDAPKDLTEQLSQLN